MAEIEFFATGEEMSELVQWLLDRHWQFVPNLHYRSSSFERLREVRAIQSVAESVPKFFVVREDLLESPLMVKETGTADKHFFYIVQRNGGPALDFWWGQQFEEDGHVRLCATEPEESRHATLHHLPYGHFHRRASPSQPLHRDRRRNLEGRLARPL